MPPVRLTLILTGSAYVVAMIALAASQAPLGTLLFFALAAVGGVCYLVMLRRVWNETLTDRRLLHLALLLAVAFRIPLAVPAVGADNDMVRYLWDGRVQRLGYNPYAVLPADPEMSVTHTDETRQMPSRRARTPYPPGAQLFFRLVTGIHESTRAMKFALVLCDLLTILVVWRWLTITGRNEWLTLAYAWNPLVVLEVAHSGHIDALGALWIAASAYWLARRRTSLASVAFVLAVATKLLPIVLAPLYWRRIRLRDALIGGALFVALYVPFTTGTTLPVGAVPNVVAHIRFNGPFFRGLAAAASPQAAAAAAVLLGLALAAWFRWKRPAADPAAWAWPMAAALVLAPVIYPWYLLYFTPFLFVRSTWPLLAWTFSVIPVYVVWDLSRRGGRWIVPGWVMIVEFAAVLAVAAVLFLRHHGPQHDVDENAGERGGQD
jgi:hypothetical protein